MAQIINIVALAAFAAFMVTLFVGGSLWILGILLGIVIGCVIGLYRASRAKIN